MLVNFLLSPLTAGFLAGKVLMFVFIIKRESFYY